MFIQFKRRLSAVAILPVLFFGLLGCSDKSNDDTTVTPTDSEYHIWAMVGSEPNRSTLVLSTPSVEEGTLNFVNAGADVTSSIPYGLIMKDGYYYGVNDSRFGKYRIENDKVIVVNEVPFTLFTYFFGHTWLDDHTLLLTGANGDGNGAVYAKVNTTTMDVTTGTFTLPAIPADFTKYTIGLVSYRNDNKLFLTYTHFHGTTYVYDTKMYIAVLNATTMAVESVTSDTRSVVPGGYNYGNLYQPYCFTDESNNFYFVGLARSGNGTNSLLRINNGTTVPDASFQSFNDTSKSISGIWYLGSGKAIVRIFNPSLYDYANGKLNAYEFYTMDVTSGALQKLDVPACKAGYINNVTLSDGKAYIITNQEETGDGYIWVYNNSTGVLSKGMTVPAGYTYLLRVEKVK